MKKLMIVALALSLFVATAAFAQPEARDVGVFADPTGTLSTVTTTPSVTFTVFVIGFGLDGQVKGYEVSVNVPANHFLLAGTPNPVTSLNFGDVDGEFIIGTGGCFEGEPQYTLVTLTFLPLVPVVDGTVCVFGTDPSSFAGGLPGYLQCDGTLVPFGVAQDGEGRYPNGCLVLNPTQDGPVATEAPNFGEIKSRF